MASPLKDIKKNYCECAICLSDLKNPKQLPECLHRFCRDCLSRVIPATGAGSFKCPLCKHKYPTNGEGVDRFVSDLPTEQVVMFIREREDTDPEYETRMAAPFSESLHELKREFMRCPVCGLPFEDPRQLTECLHRICRACLERRLQENVGTFNCPICWQEYIIPAKGVDHYKSDLHLKNVVDIFQRKYFSDRSATLSLPTFVSNGVIRDQDMTVVDIKGIKAKKWGIQNMTSIRSGRIFVTGTASDDTSHITLTNMKGEIDLLHQVPGSIQGPVRYCDAFSRNRVITICMSNQFFIYNIRRGGCIKKDISHVTDQWPPNQYVCCLTVSPLKKHIFVGSLNIGGESRDVLVFDGKLKYLHTLKLPKITRESRDITAHGNNLIVCDSSAKEAYAVATNAQDAKLVYKLPKPGDRENCYPFRVCTDSCGYIYMLWSTTAPTDARKTVLTQYSRDGRKLLTTLPVDDDAFALCTASTEGGEKLLIATRYSGKLYTYHLVT